MPPETRGATARVQPATLDETISIKHARSALGARDGFVHQDDAPETHVFNFLVGEHGADEACDFWVWCHVLPLGGFRTDVCRVPIVFREERTFHDGDFGYDTFGRLEVGRQEDLLRVLNHVVAVVLQVFDPACTRGAIRPDCEADDSIFFALRTDDFGKRQFTAEKAVNTIFATQLVPHRVNAINGLVVSGHFNLLAHIGH